MELLQFRTVRNEDRNSTGRNNLKIKIKRNRVGVLKKEKAQKKNKKYSTTVMTGTTIRKRNAKRIYTDLMQCTKCS